MNDRENQIIRAVDRLSDDILDFTCRLVAEPSILENEASVMQVMEEELRKLSFDPVQLPVDPKKLSGHPGFAKVPWSYEGRYNLVATREDDGTGGNSALFKGHLDVVSAEPLSLWDKDPFVPFIQDGWLCGRGSGDMKSGVAAMTYAVHALEQEGFGLRAPVTVEAVIEEECGGNGTLACLEQGYDADAVLIPEPFGPAIMTGQLGIMWFKIHVSGVPRHVLEATAGVNAIEKCFPLIAALRNLEAEMNQETHPAYDATTHPLNLNIGIINGGDWPSTVPASAEFHCRLSYFPGTTYEQMCQRVVETVDNAVKADPWLLENPPDVEFYGFRWEGLIVDRNKPAFHILNDCHRDLNHMDAPSLNSTAGTDISTFHHFGRSSGTCYGPVAENIHAANERVDIKSVINTARVYALFLSRWCGLVE